MKKLYLTPVIKQEIIEIEQSIAAGSASVSPDASDSGVEIIWQEGENVSGEMGW